MDSNSIINVLKSASLSLGEMALFYFKYAKWE